MEIDITDFFNAAAPGDYSASIAERGKNAGPETWNAAKADAPGYASLLPDDAARDAFHEHMQAMGFSEAGNFKAWPREESIALFMQLIAGDMREADIGPESDDADWKRYEHDASEGLVSGNIYRGDDGRIYYYLGV